MPPVMFIYQRKRVCGEARRVALETRNGSASSETRTAAGRAAASRRVRGLSFSFRVGCKFEKVWRRQLAVIPYLTYLSPTFLNLHTSFPTDARQIITRGIT